MARKRSKKKNKKGKRKDQNIPNVAGFGGLQSGGLVNTASGMGSASDKSEAFFFTPTRVTNAQEYETIYNESWAAKKFINIPIDDMFTRRRTFPGLDKDIAEAYDKYIDRIQIYSRLAKAMKAGRLYGTGLLCFLTKEAPPETPLDIRRLRPGDLSNIFVANRFNGHVLTRNRNPFEFNYGKADSYHISPRQGGSFNIHHSRVFRFDGQEPLTSDGWSTYEQDWGVSSIIPVLSSIYQEESVPRSVSHLMQEYSIPYHKIEGFKNIISTGFDEEAGGMSLEQLAEASSLLKSMYREKYMDSEDEFGRIEASISGIAELLDRFSGRVASAADIPKTRFLGDSPTGLNSTGDGEHRDYALKVGSDQENKLRPDLEQIDRILVATSGIDIDADALKFQFPSLIDASESEQVEVAGGKVEAVEKAVDIGLITREEGRDILDGDPVFGNLDSIDMESVQESGGDSGNQVMEFMRNLFRLGSRDRESA